MLLCIATKRCHSLGWSEPSQVKSSKLGNRQPTCSDWGSLDPSRGWDKYEVQDN